MKKGRLLTALGLALFCIIIILPPLIHGYIYPNVGDDTASHLQVLDMMKRGDPISSQFAISYKVVGYPLFWIGDLTGWSMDALFLWFNYAALALIGLTIYLVMSRLAGRRAGWLSLVITLFCAQGILFQFYYGQIFNAINMGAILPLLLFFTVRYLREGRVYQFALALLIGVLFGSFHTSGIYLPFVAGFATAVYLAWCLLKRRRIQVRFVSLGGSLVALPAIAFVLLVPGVWDLVHGVMRNIGLVMAVPAGNYLMGIVSSTVLVLLSFIIVFFRDILRNIFGESKILAALLCCVAVVLAVSAFAKLSLDPFRQALDLATVLALLVSVLVVSFGWTRKRELVGLVLVLAIGFGLWHNLPTWFDYNSAVRPADREAITYMNTLDIDEYNCSPQVAYWIYDRFVEAKYSVNASGLLIVRSLPMTPRSDPKNKWYGGHGIYPDDGYALLKTFKDGKVTVKVYEKVKETLTEPIEDGVYNGDFHDTWLDQLKLHNLDDWMWECDGIICRYDFPDDVAWIKYMMGDSEWVKYAENILEVE
jgi:hypothetical protein